MGRYRKIDTRIWNDAKFRNLSDRAKLAFFFLLTHPHMTSLGAMRATVPGLAMEIGWPEKAFREAFREALAKGMAKHDEEACFLCLPNFIRYNPPESPNVVKSWLTCVDLLPECESKVQLLQHVKAFGEGLGEGFRKAFAFLEKALPKGMPNPEQEQEPKQEPKHEHEQDTPKAPKGDFVSQFDAFWKAFPSGRKQGKELARKAFRLALKKADAETITAAATEYACSVTGKGKFVKGPASWLNQGCWDDDREAWNRTDDGDPPSKAGKPLSLEELADWNDVDGGGT